MQLEQYRIIFISIGLIGILLFALPSINLLIKPPSDQQFSELYLLGSDHMIDNYPYAIVAGKNYPLYVGVGNHLGSAAYYTVYVKLVNKTDLLPNANLATPSSSPPIFEYKFFLTNEAIWESPLVFSVSKTSSNADGCIINQLSINGDLFNVNKASTRDTNSTGFYYGLVCELWVYNTTNNSFQYHNRAVNLKLNLLETT